MQGIYLRFGAANTGNQSLGVPSQAFQAPIIKSVNRDQFVRFGGGDGGDTSGDQAPISGGPVIIVKKDKKRKRPPQFSGGTELGGQSSKRTPGTPTTYDQGPTSLDGLGKKIKAALKLGGKVPTQKKKK
ncbi:MAG: hypothetical protein VKJ04_03840 [Vampirovibrionales bacterium]|nr:hypothetical protein [Vampirovibrionales bacterium]